MKRLAVLLLLVACGGSAPDVTESPAASAEAVAALGIPCTPGRPVECPVVVGLRAGDICGNDRFGWTCTAYCSDGPCQAPGTKCLPRIGDEDAGLDTSYAGFCWRACAKDADCVNGLRCHTVEGVCGP